MPAFEIRHDPLTRTLTFAGSFDEDELARIRLSEEDHFKIFRAERQDAKPSQMLSALATIFELIEISKNRLGGE